ncbi:MAG TPA: hypothetical protein VFH63_08365 [candidate division Zixibacteria bacterium]|nr:hypothetical protein [candidate division Zixibacteria bacterium]
MIEATRRLAGAIGSLPAAARVGLLVMAMSVVLSATTHAAAGPLAHTLPAAQAAHLVALTGMVVVWAAVVVDGRRHHTKHRAAEAAHTGGE